MSHFLWDNEGPAALFVTILKAANYLRRVLLDFKEEESMDREREIGTRQLLNHKYVEAPLQISTSSTQTLNN
jgi:hypothetical protein